MVAILCGSLVGNGGNIESFSEAMSGTPLMEDNTIAGPMYIMYITAVSTTPVEGG